VAGGGFRYALEPIVLQRQWAIDEARRALADCNAALAERRAACELLQQQVKQAELQWQALGAGQRVLSVDQFVLVSRYLAERRGHLRQAQQAEQRQQEQCDQVVEQLLAARRQLDAVEEHKDGMWKQFVQQRLSEEFKVADDQWNVLQAGIAEHGN
jgi:flagellar biosynthesis chaperone FliJ